MIGLDSYSRQVFIYLDPILIYTSLWIDCLFEIRKIAVFPLAFIAGWLQGHWWGFISRNYVVWPTFLLMNVFIALKGSHFWFLFVCFKDAYLNCNWSFFLLIFLNLFVLKVLLASDIPVLLLLYEMVLRCNNGPENLVNNVWIAEFYPGYEHRLHKGSNSTMNNNLR